LAEKKEKTAGNWDQNVSKQFRWAGNYKQSGEGRIPGGLAEKTANEPWDLQGHDKE